MNIIGLDIGGTKIAGIVFNGKKAVKSLIIPTPKSLASFKASLVKLSENLCMGEKVEAMGIGMAGVIDHKKNIVKYSPNLKFTENLNFNELFPKIKKLKVDNDANCFARAEAVMGQGRSFKNFVGITLGTGIGGALVSNKEVYLGLNGSAGEVGHMMYDTDKNIEHYFQKARDASNYKQISKIVGMLLVNVYNLLDVEAVIFGGGVAIKNHERFLPFAVEHAQKHLTNKDIKIKALVSNLENAGALGAVLLIKK
jgi:glucokinase